LDPEAVQGRPRLFDETGGNGEEFLAGDPDVGLDA